MRLCLICNSLSEGGAGRVAALLANGFAADGWAVTLMTTDDGSEERISKLVPEVIHMPLSIEHASSSPARAVFTNVKRAGIIRRAVLGTGAGLVISFLDRTNVLVLLATRGTGIGTIVSERTDPAGRSIGLPWETMRFLTYTWAGALVCQGQCALSSFRRSVRLKGCVIPNPVIISNGTAGKSRQNSSGLAPYRLVAMGTFKPEKGFDLLVRAFARVVSDHPDWSLTIWGDGPERGAIDRLRRKLGISNRVHLPGRTQKPQSKLAECDLFVLSSRVEGFPNALVEAMAVGLPVIATDVGAVTEIIRPGVDGTIVRPGDERVLAFAMDRLMGDGGLRREMGLRGRDVLIRFSLEKVLGMWKGVIQRVVGLL